MGSNRLPLALLALASAFAALFQLPRSVGSSQKQAEGVRQEDVQQEARTREKAGETADLNKPKDDPWSDEAEVVRGFFGDKSAQAGEARSGEEMVTALGGKARDASLALESLVVLAPDPVETGLATGFDEALAAVQEAYADTGYILDRFWLPWTGKALEQRDYREIPGLLLFRPFDENDKKLAAVLVVGEVPRQGVHPGAFRKALELVNEWQQRSNQSVEGPPFQADVRIVGPYFSDSADSLHRNLDSESLFRIVSGTAMAHRLPNVLKGPKEAPRQVEFGQSVVPDAMLQERAGAFFTRLGWDTTRVALLAQADTAFEQPFLTDTNRNHFILVRFPTGIAGIRTAWESDVKPSSSQEGQEALKVPKTTLDITLTDRSQPVHLLPETGSFTAASRDLAISNLLAVIGSRQIDYIGIIASDPRDTLFLAERIRRLAPSKILFIINSHLLFNHPTWAPLMNGTLVLSGYPLFAEGPRWRNELGGPSEGKYLRQFTSSFHQGIYRAVGSLRSRAELPRGQQQLLWMSVIGNSSLWPIACLGPPSPAPSARAIAMQAACVSTTHPEPKPSDTGEIIGNELSYRINTKLIWFFLALCLLAGALIGFGEVPPSVCDEARLPLLVAPSVLWLAGGVLTVLGALPYHHLGVRPTWDRDWRLLIAGSLMLLLLALLARFMTSTWKLARWVKAFVALLIAGALLFFLIDHALSSLWMPGGAENFYQRVFVLSSGFSPLVSLAWLGGALYLWSFAELRRYRMVLRQRLHRPLPTGLAEAEGMVRDFEFLQQIVLFSLPQPLQFRRAILFPFVTFSVLLLFDLYPLVEINVYDRIFLTLLGLSLALAVLSLCRYLQTGFQLGILFWAILSLMLTITPSRNGSEAFGLGALLFLTLILGILAFCRFLRTWKFSWMILWVIMVPAALSSVFLVLPLRPVAETCLYGRLFSMFLGLTLFLGSVSFCRFLCTWIALHRIIKRLGLPHPPRGLDTDLAKAVDWKPMKSFGWQIPCFGGSTIQAVDCLQELDEAGMLWNTGIQPKKLQRYLTEAMDAEQKGNLKLEVKKRDRVESVLCSANLTLALQGDDPLVNRFYALRLISYIRYMFAHLRAFLIASLACGFPLLAAASTYAYEPNEYVTNSIWSMLLIAVLLTLGVFFQMDRDEILSKIANTTPGEVTFNPDMVVGTVTYGIVPLLGLVVAQFPNVGRYFVTLLNPLVRALGVG